MTAHGTILAAQALGTGTSAALDAMERIGDEARRVDPVARVRRIERRIARLLVRYHRARMQRRPARASMHAASIRYWRDRLAYWQGRA